jgi:ribosomal protein S18 acetylase RimI-like enzyme
MIKATHNDRKRVVDILARSFDTNQSVNYIVQQDARRTSRIRALMAYSFDLCYLFGDVFLSDNRKACALVLYPDKKKMTLRSLLLDMRLIIDCIGLRNIKKALARETAIKKKLQPKEDMSYLWFIGVSPEHQGKGAGNRLLADVIQDSNNKRRSIYLETSTLDNLPWYRKAGFEVYNELYLSYKLFFLRRGLDQDGT